MRLLDALDRYVVQLEADGRSEHTIAQYRRHVGLLVGWLEVEEEGADLDDVTHEFLARFLTSPAVRRTRHGGERKATSANALRTSLRTFFGYCHAAGWIRENPARLVRRARCEGPPPRGLSDQDRQRLIDTLIAAQGHDARRDHLLIDLMLSTGIRLSAALALTEADVDLQRGELVVQKAKGNRVERVILGIDIRDHLVGYLGERKPGWLFPSKAGGPMSRRHAVRRLHGWMEKAGCQGRASPHGLRHDFAQRLYGRTGDVLLVMRAMGHRSLISTMVYLRSDSEALRAALG